MNGDYESYYVNIKSSWRANNGELLTYETVIPANTTATLYLPLDEDLNGSSVNYTNGAKGVNYVGTTNHNGLKVAEFGLLSGGYRFEIINGAISSTLLPGYKSE
ncbi:MAG: hypothetical protein KBG40_02715 [Bacteroidales bacterium]|nr:hypothetical protein [Bacteroidales bacterium]